MEYKVIKPDGTSFCISGNNFDGVQVNFLLEIFKNIYISYLYFDILLLNFPASESS